MCIFSLIYRVVPECPIFVLTNRDESTERPSLPPQVFSPEEHGTRWFGGADARAGGTWFGINEHGLLAAVTNRTKEPTPPNPRSRGLLCRDVLGHATATAAVDWVLRELSQHPYAGFNLAIVTTEAAWVIEAADSTSATQLGPGIHSLSNGPLRARDDPRINLAQSLVSRMVDEEHDWKAYIDRAERICRIPFGRRRPRHVSSPRPLGHCRLDHRRDCRRPPALPIPLLLRPTLSDAVRRLQRCLQTDGSHKWLIV